MTNSEFSRRGFLRASAVVGGGFLLAGCGSSAGPAGGGEGGVDVSTLSGAELEEAARAEGATVLWYNTGNPTLVESVTKGFTAAYPWMTFSGVPVPFTDLPAKVATEAITEAPTADVMWFPPTLREQMTANLILAPTTLDGDANMPPDTLDPDRVAHPVWQLGIGVVYNPDIVTGPPTTPEQLADPTWLGKIAFDRVANLGQSTTWLSVWREEMGDDAWNAWLDGLKANEVFITTAASTTYETVLRGERQIGLASSNYVINQAAGTPMAMGFDIPLVPFYNHQYLTRRAAHPASGKVFMEWASTEEGQRAIADVGLSPIMAIDTDSSLEKFTGAEGELLPGTDLAHFSANTSDYLAALTKRWPG